MIKQEIIDRIISDVPIQDVAKDEGINFVKEKGNRSWATCPFLLTVFLGKGYTFITRDIFY